MKDKFESLVDHLLLSNFFMEEAIELLEKSMIQRALQSSGGNQSAASKQLGIHRNTLQRKMVQYGLSNGRARTRRSPIKGEARGITQRVGAA